MGIRIPMKILKLINSRILVTGLLILIQLAWFVLFILKLTTHSMFTGIIFTLLSIIYVLYIVWKEENAAYKIGWIILITTLPLFGGLLYLFFGNKRPSRRLRIFLNYQREKMVPYLEQKEEVMEAVKEQDARAAGSFSYLLRASNYPIWGNTQTTYYPSGEELYQAMLLELEAAKHFIFMEYFIIEKGVMWDSILNILTRKATEGLDVRLIYDDVGCLYRLPSDYPDQMEQLGIKCIAFNAFVPILSLAVNNRDHRKITVIDGHTAFTGGANIADEYINVVSRYGHWKDSGIRLKGEAVWNFTIMFLEMWEAFYWNEEAAEDFNPHKYHPEPFKADGYVQPFADTPLDDEPVGESIYIDILNQAQSYVYIFTPYLVIDDELKLALGLAAKRGVDVRLVTPAVPESFMTSRLTRSNYSPLLRAGVRIYEYTPGLIHSKSFVSDDKLAVVGTINMDYRSLYLHFECGTYLYKTSSVMDIKKDAVDTIKISREITLEDCKQGLLGNLIDAVLRVVAPLF